MNLPPSTGDRSLADWTRRLRKTPRTTARSAHPLDIEAEVANGDAWTFAVEHVRRYIESGGADDGWDGPRPIVVLYTCGRASGQLRRSPLLCFEHAGQRHVVGSRGGTPGHPDWYLNLAARPDAYVRAGAEFYSAHAVTLADDERQRLWPGLVASYPMFADYQAATTRAIPLVRLNAGVSVR